MRVSAGGKQAYGNFEENVWLQEEESGKEVSNCYHSQWLTPYCVWIFNKSGGISFGENQWNQAVDTGCFF